MLWQLREQYYQRKEHKSLKIPSASVKNETNKKCNSHYQHGVYAVKRRDGDKKENVHKMKEIENIPIVKYSIPTR